MRKREGLPGIGEPFRPTVEKILLCGLHGLYPRSYRGFVGTEAKRMPSSHGRFPGASASSVPLLPSPDEAEVQKGITVFR